MLKKTKILYNNTDIWCVRYSKVFYLISIYFNIEKLCLYNNFIHIQKEQ